MKKIIMLTGLSAMFVGTAGYASGAHWGYEGHGGPAHWGDLASEYSMCKTGKAQSPVNIETQSVVEGTNGQRSVLKFSYTAMADNVVNNGHTIQVNMKKGSTVLINGAKYNLLQFHFHSPSENEVNGKPYDMVAHLVHANDKGQLAVIAIMFKKGHENKELEKIWANLPGHSGNKHSLTTVRVNPANLLPAQAAHYHFTGSLTTPPCSEGVNWNVMATPVEASAEQIAAFVKLFPKSVRPVQPVNGRKIVHNMAGID